MRDPSPADRLTGGRDFSNHQSRHLQNGEKAPSSWNCYKTIKNHQHRTSLVCRGSELACQCKGHGFSPWSRKISHATEQPRLGPNY